jgi:hypothetical protein
MFERPTDTLRYLQPAGDGPKCSVLPLMQPQLNDSVSRYGGTDYIRMKPSPSSVSTLENVVRCSVSTDSKTLQPAQHVLERGASARQVLETNLYTWT